MLMDHLLTPCDDLQEDPLGNVDFSWFTGHSYLNGDNGKCFAAYAIATPLDFGGASSLPVVTLAQQDELCSLPLICTLAKDKTSSIYTDSRYALRGVAHDFGKLWKQHSFLTSRGIKKCKWPHV